MIENKSGDGRKIIFQFRNGKTEDAFLSPTFYISNINYVCEGCFDGSDIDPNKIDFTKRESELEQIIRRPETVGIDVEVIKEEEKQGLFIEEIYKDLSGDKNTLLYFMYPKFDKTKKNSLVFYARKDFENELRSLEKTLIFW